MYKKNKNNVAKLLLAFGVLASPMMLANQVSADNSISNTTNFNNVDATATAQSDAVTTDNVINENKEEKEQAKEVVTTAGENTATDVTEATETTSQTDEKSNEKSDVVENKKEVDYKLDASQRHELKEAGYTDEEIQEIENSINESLAKNPNFNVYEFVVSKLEAKKPENKDKEENKEKSELEISEKQDREAVGDKTPEADAKNISNEITNVNGAIEGLINKNATTIKPIANDPNLEGKDYDTQAEGYINFDVPNTTKKGDYVDIQMTNITTVNGIVEDFNPGALDAFIGPEKIATASYDKDERILRYTFTDDVEKYGKVNISARFPLFIDKNKVTEPTSTQVVGIKVGDKAIEKTYTVDYHMDNIGQSDKFVSNGYSDISHVNLGSKSYDHIIYMNPLTKEQKGTIVQIENLPGQDGVVNDGVVFDKDVLDSVEVYAVEDVSKLPMSFAWNEETEKNLIKLPKTEPDTNKTVYTKEIVDGKIIVKINNKQDPAASLNNRGPVNNKAAIVIRYKGKLKDDAKKDTATRVTFNNSTQSKQDYFFWDNIIYTTDAAASGTGQEEVGYFQDYHVYQTIDKDGKITTDEIVFKDQQSGNKNQTYTTIRKDREGYEFISVESPDGAAFGEKGAEATGNFVNGKTLHVKYVYQKREKPAAKTGKFKETHVYKTLDFDGNVVEDKTITEAGKSSEGKKDEKYESSKVDKDGYELVKVTADKGSEKEVTISEDGKSVEPGNYVEDKELSVTYEYVRRPGRFVEKHIYQTVDKDGKVIKTDYTVVVPEEGKPAVEGFSNEQIKTGQKPRDGYTFKSETELESANYIPGKTLEKTYIYTKTQEEPAAKTGKFKETHVYKTLDFDGNVVEDKTITEAGKSSEGKKDEKYESSKVDKDGYELVKVTADKGSEKEVTISEDGKSVEPGNYVEDKELSVTYEYVRRPGRFVEKHIYQTVDKDGKVIKTDYTVVVPEEGKPAVEGFSNEQIKTGQKPRDGYTFKSETELESANYIPGKTLEKTYIYTKTQEEPAAKTGKFKETHVYKTLDFDGNVVEDKTITEAGKSSEGKKDEKYESSKVDKDGYELVKVTADKGSEKEVTISEDGKSVEPGNYVEDKELSVTYEYVRRPGRFVEKHIYQTVDKDGKVIKTDYTVVVPEEGKPAVEGFSNEQIKTGQKPRDGYTFKSETELESANYIPGKTLEKTYIYTKTQEEPAAKTGKFKETHVYKTLDFDGNVVEDKTITEAGKSSEGKKDEKYESSKVDKDGYELVKVTADKGSEKEVTISEDGKSVEPGNYVEDKELSVTYEYVRRPGRFVEKHIYQTVDKDGKVIKTDYTVVVPEEGKPAVEGFSNEQIKTGQKPRDGYTFKSETELESANYIPGKTLEKTYIYTKTQDDKPIEKNGSFQEHHVYEVYKDGKLVESSEITLEETTGTEEEYFNTSAKPNGTKEQPKEGFTLVKELIAKSIDVKSHLTGEEIKEHYKNNEKLEVRYVYRKDITTPTTPETPWTPLEPSEPVTPVEPEEPVTPVEPEEPVTPVEPEEPTTPVVPDQPEEPTTPVTPQTPDHKETPKDDSKEAPKDEPKETPKEDSKETPKDESKETSEKQTKKQSKKLPKAGADYELLQLAAGALTLVSGMGISLSRKKRD